MLRRKPRRVQKRVWVKSHEGEVEPIVTHRIDEKKLLRLANNDAGCGWLKKKKSRNTMGSLQKPPRKTAGGCPFGFEKTEVKNRSQSGATTEGEDQRTIPKVKFAGCPDLMMFREPPGPRRFEK